MAINIQKSMISGSDFLVLKVPNEGGTLYNKGFNFRIVVDYLFH